MIVHKANTEKDRLTSLERLKRDYVSENYGIVAAVVTVDNADSSVRIKGLYDALHVGPAFAIVPSVLYPLFRRHLSALVDLPRFAANHCPQCRSLKTITLSKDDESWISFCCACGLTFDLREQPSRNLFRPRRFEIL